MTQAFTDLQQRYLAVARRLGSRATTTRGARRYLQQRSSADRRLALGMTSTQSREERIAEWTGRQQGRRLRRDYRDPDRRIADVVSLVQEIEEQLANVQRRCRARCLSSDDVLRCLFRREDTGREYVASSYAYSYSWTQCLTWRQPGGVVAASIERVSAAYEVYAAEPRIRVHRETLRRLACGGALLAGDVIAIRSDVLEGGDPSIYVRVDRDGRRTGVTCRLPKDLRGLHGWGLHGWGRWEHADTSDRLRQEIARKREILAAERKRERESERAERRARLLARLSRRLRATFADARAVGYCEAGILAWCRAHGIDPEDSVDLASLMHDADRRAQAVALRVARQTLRAREAAA